MQSPDETPTLMQKRKNKKKLTIITSPEKLNNETSNVVQKEAAINEIAVQHRKKKKNRKQLNKGPRVQYSFVDKADLRVSPVSSLSTKARIVKTVVCENPGSRRTGHYRTHKRGKPVYVVSLPQNYRDFDFLHFSKRRSGSIKSMKKNLVRKNTFFSPKSQLRPGSAPLNRRHPSLHLRKASSYNVLVDEYLEDPKLSPSSNSSKVHNHLEPQQSKGNDFVTNKQSLQSQKSSSPVFHSKRYGFNYTSHSPINRAMSHSERHSLRPQTAKLRRSREKINRKEKMLSTRPSSAGGRNMGRKDGASMLSSLDSNDPNFDANETSAVTRRQYLAKTWKPELNPQILNRHASIPTSRGPRKITKILKIRPKKSKLGKKRQIIRSRTSGHIVKPLARPKSAGAVMGGNYQISTRNPPHFPVKISMYQQLAHRSFPVAMD